VKKHGAIAEPAFVPQFELDAAIERLASRNGSTSAGSTQSVDDDPQSVDSG
jgi:hypothetical protein